MHTHYNKQPTPEVIFNILNDLNKEIIREHLNRPLLPGDSAKVNVNYKAKGTEPHECYKLYYNSTLLGYMYYGFVSIYTNLMHRRIMDNYIKIEAGRKLFKTTFIHAIQLN